ncbi:MAG: hypothetical protein PHN72_03500 [Bacilli bacterium]|nr:hypothetical protein [Bacilli bacterium]
MNEVYFALGAFISIYLLYLILIVLRKKGLDNFENSTEMLFLKKKYHIKVTAQNAKSLAHTVAVSNALVVSLTLLCVSMIDNLPLKIVVAMGVLVPMILVVYSLIGKIYQKKERKKHV